MASEGGSSGIKGFVKDAAVVAIGTTVLDFFIEVAGIPWLNEQSSFPILDHQQTWIETIITGAGLVSTSLGALSVFTGKTIIPGFGKEALSTGIGLLAGETFYEYQLVKMLGIRNIRHGVYK